MSVPTFYVSLLLVWCLLYVVAPVLLMVRGWFTSAGAVQLVGAVLPGIWHGIFWPNEAGNFGLLIMVLVPIPLSLTACGLVALLVRGATMLVRAARKL